ncbi:MAG: metallophosphoesterase family protein [Planctomycetes bacterium]|nr:metallophosphoesterase family protein [Planctomycetota bacterium]
MPTSLRAVLLTFAWLLPCAAPRAQTAAAVPVPANATWRYLDQGVGPAPGWQLPGFDDSSWPAGPAQLGYGDGDEATVIQSGPPGAFHLISWFRHEFAVAAPTAWPSARVRLVCDDGAVVYVNGVEVGRWNLNNGPILPWASLAMAGADESAVRVFAFPPSLLVAGANCVTAEVHQVSGTSSDVSFQLELAVGPEPVTITRGPYLQNGTATGGVVRWRTDQPTATQLWLGPTAANLQPVHFDATLRTDHAAPVGGLSPETTYHYAVGDDTGVLPGQLSPQTLRTLPPPGAVRPLRVWAVGDAGIGWLPQYAVREAYAAFVGTQPADVLLFLGDNAYFVGTDAEYQVGVFDAYRRELATTFAWSTLGNHDAVFVDTAAQTGPYYDVFTHPTAGEAGGVPSGTEAYYSFDRGHVHFVCLDSQDSDRSATGPMATWLAADLAAATAARWVVAFFHHPPYSAGSHDSDDPLDSGGRMRDMREVVLPLLEAFGVDLVLSGHSHVYERSRLLDGHYGDRTTLQPAMLLDRGDGADAGDGHYAKAATGPAPHQGTIYVVAGSAGQTAAGPLDHPVMQVAVADLGSLVLDFDGDRLDARFVGLGGIADHFTLQKGEPRTLRRDQPRIPVAAGGRQDLQLTAGPAQALRVYILAGSYGTEPGFPLWGVHVPLNPDPWFTLSLQLANSPIYQNSIGLLDATGSANAAFVLPPLTDPVLVGTVVHHAYVVGDGATLTLASNPVRLRFEP